MALFLKGLLPALDYAALFLFSWIGAVVFGVLWIDNFLPKRDEFGNNMLHFEVVLAAVGLVLLLFLGAALYLDFFRKPRGKGKFLAAFFLAGIFLWQFVNFPLLWQIIGAAGIFLAYAALKIYAFVARS